MFLRSLTPAILLTPYQCLAHALFAPLPCRGKSMSYSIGCIHACVSVCVCVRLGPVLYIYYIHVCVCLFNYTFITSIYTVDGGRGFEVFEHSTPWKVPAICPFNLTPRISYEKHGNFFHLSNVCSAHIQPLCAPSSDSDLRVLLAEGSPICL